MFIPFVHRPLSRYVNASAVNGAGASERMVESAPPPGFLGWPRSTPSTRPSPVCCSSCSRRRAEVQGSGPEVGMDSHE